MLFRSASLRRLCAARDLLREVTDEPRTIAAIAAAVGISPAHFTRQFAALFGETPHQFRMRERVAQARRLLVEGHGSVTDTCMAVGGTSLGSFSALFTRLTGESPSGYRRRLRPLVAAPGQRLQTLYPGCLTLLARLPAGSQFSRSDADRVVTDSSPAAGVPGSARCGSD